jgi:transcriptional regulator with XRE-family HTH domain
MLPVELQTPRELSLAMAARIRALRLERGWTQQELADRAGIAFATYRAFERAGRISLERLLKIATVLDALAGFDQLFTPPPARSLSELAVRNHGMSRKRGGRKRAKTRGQAALGR